MKKTVCLLLLFAYLLPFTVLAQTSVDAQIKRVEQGFVARGADQRRSVEDSCRANEADGTFIGREQKLKYTFVKGAAGVSELKVTLPDATIVTAPKVAADALIPFEHLNAGNFDEALAGYRQIKKDTPDNAAISQFRLNGLGYGYMRAKKCRKHPKNTNAAEALKKLNGAQN